MAKYTAAERLANAMLAHVDSLARSADFASAVAPLTDPVEVSPKEKRSFLEWIITSADADRAVRLASTSAGDRDVAYRLLDRLADEAPLLRDALGAWGHSSARELPAGERRSWKDLLRAHADARRARRQEILALIFRYGLTPDPVYVSAELLEASEIVAQAIENRAEGCVTPSWLTLVERLCVRFDEVDDEDAVNLDALAETDRFFGPVEGIATTTRTLHPRSRPRRERPGSPAAKQRRTELEAGPGREGVWVLVNEGRWRPFAELTPELLEAALRTLPVSGSWHVYEIKHGVAIGRLSLPTANGMPRTGGVLRLIGFEIEGQNRANKLTDDFVKQHATTFARERDRVNARARRSVPNSK